MTWATDELKPQRNHLLSDISVAPHQQTDVNF